MEGPCLPQRTPPLATVCPPWARARVLQVVSTPSSTPCASSVLQHLHDGDSEEETASTTSSSSLSSSSTGSSSRAMLPTVNSGTVASTAFSDEQQQQLSGEDVAPVRLVSVPRELTGVRLVNLAAGLEKQDTFASPLAKFPGFLMGARVRAGSADAGPCKAVQEQRRRGEQRRPDSVPPLRLSSVVREIEEPEQQPEKKPGTNSKSAKKNPVEEHRRLISMPSCPGQISMDGSPAVEALSRCSRKLCSVGTPRDPGRTNGSDDGFWFMCGPGSARDPGLPPL